MEFNFDKIKSNGEGEPMLVTLKQWIMAGDGNTYLHVWGNVKIHKADDIVGFHLKDEVNWVAQIGSGETALFILGCQIRSFKLCKLTDAIKTSNSILKLL